MSDDVCLSCGPSERSPANLEACIDQFKSDLLGKWEPRDGLTWCNQFAQAVTAALQCPIPMALANEQIAWLEGLGGKSSGWTETTREHAITSAQVGNPTLVTWANPTGHGHIAVLRPAPPGHEHDAPFIAQAGRENFWIGRLQRGFGHLPVRFWSHP
jgi:hypothetical protein